MILVKTPEFETSFPRGSAFESIYISCTNFFLTRLLSYKACSYL